MGKFVRKRINNQQDKSIEYDSLNEPLSLHRPVVDILIKDKQYANLLALYTFYYRTAKWQNTNVIKAINFYTSQVLGWGESKIIETRKRLKEYGLIEEIHKRNSEGGKFIGHYIKVNVIPITTPWFLQSWTNQGEYALKNNILGSPDPSMIFNKDDEDKTNLPITQSMFDKFWKVYPKKVNYQKAKISWGKACKLPKDQRPTFHQVIKAVFAQIKSERWQDSKYIPMPTTWLNQARWLDDPKELIIYDKPTERITCPMGFTFGKSLNPDRIGCQRCEDNYNKVYQKCLLMMRK